MKNIHIKMSYLQWSSAEASGERELLQRYPWQWTWNTSYWKTSEVLRKDSNFEERMLPACLRVCVRACVFVCFHWWSLFCLWWCLPCLTCLIAQIDDLVLWTLYWMFPPSFFISVSESIIFHLQRWTSSKTTNSWENGIKWGMV